MSATESMPIARPATPSALRPALALIGLTGAAIGGVEIALFVDDPTGPVWVLVVFAAVGMAYLPAGLLAWSRRPANRTGVLLCLCGFGLLLQAMLNTTVPPLVAAGVLAGDLPAGVLLHMLLAFPSGRLPNRRARALAVTGYVVTVSVGIPHLLFGWVPNLPPALVLAERPDLIDRAWTVQHIAGIVIGVLVALDLFGRVRAADGHQRRTLAAVGGYGLFVIAFLIGSVDVARLLDLDPVVLFMGQITVVAGLPVAFVAGVLRGGFARTGEINELGAWLGAQRRPELRDALAATLGDPSLELLVLPHGYSEPPPALPHGRARVEVELAEERVGAIVYDAALIADADLVRAAGRVVALAIERERLTAELRQSRVRIVDAADGERRRIARDLHDGLQAHLVVLGMRAERLADSPTSDGAAALAAGLLHAVATLREVVQGIMPALLLERGLYAATEDLVRRVPLHARLDLPEPDGPLPAPVETVGYFVVAEALTNVVKHACATELCVRVTRSSEHLQIEVRDNGNGHADLAKGSGLRGLADRVDVLGGRFALDSTPGHGTNLVVELPCAS